MDEGLDKQANLLRTYIALMDQNHTPLFVAMFCDICCQHAPHHKHPVNADLTFESSTKFHYVIQFLPRNWLYPTFDAYHKCGSDAAWLGQMRKYSACGFSVFVCTVSPYASIVMPIRCHLTQSCLQVRTLAYALLVRSVRRVCSFACEARPYSHILVWRHYFR